MRTQSRRPRLSQMRFQLRGILITIAILAVLLSAGRLLQRRNHALVMQLQHRSLQATCLAKATLHESVAIENENEARRLEAANHNHEENQVEHFLTNIKAQAAIERAAEQKERDLAQFHEDQYNLYKQIAQYPWLIVDLK